MTIHRLNRHHPAIQGAGVFAKDDQGDRVGGVDALEVMLVFNDTNGRLWWRMEKEGLYRYPEGRVNLRLRATPHLTRLLAALPGKARRQERRRREAEPWLKEIFGPDDSDSGGEARR